MESVVRATAELRPLSNVPAEKFNENSIATSQKLESLFRALDSLTGESRMLSPEVANYVNAPIFNLLQQEKLVDRQTEYVLKILRFLVEFPWSNSLTLPMARQYISVCVYITAPLEKGREPGEALKDSSSEVRAAGFKCLVAILNVAQALGFSSDLEGPQTLGLIVFGLNGIKVGKESFDQLAALEFLSSVLFTVVSRLQPVLPNTASILSNFIIGGYGYKHTEPRVAAITILTQLLVNVLDKTGEWARNASVQIDKILVKMAKDLPKNNQQVRSALVNLATELAQQCWEPLELCQGTLLDILLLATSDTQPQFLAQEKYQAALDAKMLEYMDLLPTTLSSHDPSAATSQLAALQKYVVFKPNQLFADALVMRIQESLPPLSQTSKAMQTDVFDASKIMNLITTKGNDTVLALEELNVATGIDSQVQSSLYYLLRSLGSTTASPALLASFLEQLDSESGLASVQTLWIVSCLIDGSKDLEIANDYLGYAYSIVNNSVSFYKPEKATPSVIALNAYLIGEIALKLNTEFQEYLVDGLFPVIDLLGSGQSLVVVQAKGALEKIAAACGYCDVKELILNNKDYVLDGISAKLNTMDITPATLNMLGVLILVAGNDIVVYLDDIISSLFIILDRYHGYSTLVAGIFGIFSAVIQVMTSAMPPHIEEPPSQDTVKILSMQDFNQEMDRKPVIDESILDPPDTKYPNFDEPRETDEEKLDLSDDGSDKDDFEPPMPDTEEWKSPVEKPVYMIAKRIFDKCLLFLTHESPVLQANILRVVAQCVSVLGTNKNEFLPEVNAIWPVIVARTIDSEVYVCENAFDAVAVICSSAADFMSSRMEKLWAELLESRPASFYARKYPEFSPENRWISALTSCLSRALVYTRVDFETFDSILWTLKPLLRLHENLLSSLDRINPDDVWLCLEN